MFGLGKTAHTHKVKGLDLNLLNSELGPYFFKELSRSILHVLRGDDPWDEYHAYLHVAHLFCLDNKILGNDFDYLLEDEQNVKFRGVF